MPPLTTQIGIAQSSILAALLVCLPVNGPAAGEDRGKLEGKVTLADGRPLAGVQVTVEGMARADVTAKDGGFLLKRIPAGTYTIIFTFGENTARRSEVTITAGESVSIKQAVDWDIGLIETVTVYSASRREEQKIEAPSAVTRVSQEEIERQASHGQLPLLLEFTPGVEITQSGLYTFNVNTRGFNDTLNTRVEVRIDGRTAAVPAGGFVGWARFAFPLDDLASVEFLRGPSSALYGANAYSGVIDMKTRAPRDSQGGTFRLTAGELDSKLADLRWAGELGNNWYMKIVGSWRDSDDFTVPRATSAEYSVLCPTGVFQDCLLVEEFAPPLSGPEISSVRLRLDKYLADDSLLTIEVSTFTMKGVVSHTGGGRSQFLDNDLPWGRIAYSNKTWDFFVSYLDSSATTFGLTSGDTGSGRGTDLQVRALGHWTAADNVRLVAGLEFQEIDIKSGVIDVDPATGEKTDFDVQSAFGQVDWDVTERLKLVGAARLDDSFSYDPQLSPKVAAIYRFKPSQTLRFTFNRAFRTSNGVGLYLDIPVAPPADLQSVFCEKFGVDCGLSATPVLAVGNNNLKLEESTTFEVGYTGIFANKVMITLDVYRSKIKDFMSQNIVAQLGTSLGRVNPDYGPWMGTPEAENTPIRPGKCVVPGFTGQTVADCVRAGVPALSNKFDGSSAIVVLTFPNLGDVDTLGADLGVQYYFTKGWTLFFTYSWFDADIKLDGPDAADLLTPNTPDNKAGAGLEFTNRRFNARLAGRWVEGFRWVGGLYIGPVESYTTVDLNANYDFNKHWRVGVNVSNLLDNDHYEAFGGNLLGRRALASLTYSW